MEIDLAALSEQRRAAGLGERLVEQRAALRLQQLHSPAIQKALSHNQFGCISLEAGLTDKARIHLEQACQAQLPLPFSNAHMNLGNLFSQLRDYKRAAECYQRVLVESPHRPEFDPEGVEQQFREVMFCSKLNSRQAYNDAHTNLSVLYVNSGREEQAYRLIVRSIELNPFDSVALTNLGDILRQIGMHQQAVSLTWQLIANEIGPGWEIPKPVAIQGQPSFSDAPCVDVLVVKWGTRYPAYYVNRLFKAIRRHYSKQFRFVCFTQDGAGLDPKIAVQPLEQGWQGWWGKVTLFKWASPNRKVYIDLDTIVTGSLDKIFSYSGQFGTLSSAMFECEKKHLTGLNSSLMIWNGDGPLHIYQTLKEHRKAVGKFLRRFDFWLEMNLSGPHLLDAEFKGLIVDFLRDCQTSVPEGASIVNFPRKPKPDDYPAPWVKQLWNDQL